jgi:uncharacterized integral membrane protein
MRRLIVLPITIVFLVVLVSFTLSNTQMVTVGLWPTGMSTVLPLSLAMLASMAAAFFVGGVLIWGASLGARHRARRAEEQVRLLEAEIATLKAAASAPALPPPG